MNISLLLLMSSQSPLYYLLKCCLRLFHVTIVYRQSSLNQGLLFDDYFLDVNTELFCGEPNEMFKIFEPFSCKKRVAFELRMNSVLLWYVQCWIRFSWKWAYKEYLSVYTCFDDACWLFLVMIKSYNSVLYHYATVSLQEWSTRIEK